MAVTTYSDEIATPLGPFDRAWSGIKTWANGVSKSIQLSQMIRALSELDDKQLQKIGLVRANIPSHAYKIVYENC